MVAVLRQVPEIQLDGVVTAVFSGPPSRRRGRPRSDASGTPLWTPPPITRAQRGDKVLDGYFSDLRRYNPLTMDEERELFIRHRNGDTSARRTILLHNLRFVVRVAKEYAASGMPLTDLISEGNHGLVTAFEKFDVDRNFKFISYAVWWIRQSILRAISLQSRQLKLPLNQTQKVVAIGKATERLQQRNRRQPSVEEIAGEAGLKVNEVISIMTAISPHSSMDCPVGRGNMSFADVLPDGEDSVLDRMVRDTMSSEVVDALSVLNGRERGAVLQYYGFQGEHESTLQDIGDKMGVSRERVRQLRDHALKKLRTHMEGGAKKGARNGRKKKGGGKKTKKGEAEG